MAMRIKKVIGYGTTELSKLPIDVNRFHNEDEVEKKTYPDFLKFVKIRSTELQVKLIMLDALSCNNIEYMFNLYAYEPETADENVFVMIPAMFAEFNRSDDAIDYYEWMINHPTLNDRVQMIGKPIYPYCSYMKPDDSPSGVANVTLEHGELIRMGIEEKQKLIPFIPYDVKLLLEYLELVPDHKTALDVYFKLRPMIYTYWS